MYLKNRKKLVHSISFKLMAWSIVVMGIILGFFWIGVSLAMRSFEKQLDTTNHQILHPYAREMELTMENIEKYIAMKNIPYHILEQSFGETELERLTALKELNEKFSVDLLLYPRMDAVFLQYEDTFRFIRNANTDYEEQLIAEAYLKEFLSEREEEDNLFAHGWQIFENQGKHFFYIGANMISGYLGCWIDAEHFLEGIQISGVKGLCGLVLRDQEGNDLTMNRLAEDVEYLTVGQEDVMGGLFSMTALIDKKEALSSFYSLQKIVLALFGVCVLGLIFYLIYLSRRLVKPVRNLTQQVNKISGGDFTPFEIPAGLDVELAEVYEAMQTMTAEIEHLKIGIYEEKLIHQEADFQLLQLQIKPHFFLNTLTTIQGYIQSQNVKMAERMVLCLSEHFRYILYSGKFISVEEELEHIGNYLEIQKMQKQLPVSYQIFIPEELYDEEIPILSLQTVVENSMKHSGKSCIEIRIKGEYLDEQSGFRIIVEDNGNGFEPEVLAMLNCGEKLDGENSGIGLYNIRQRIHFLYNGEGTLKFSNGFDGGACVEMTLPIERKMH